jgi:hypothetical protein
MGPLGDLPLPCGQGTAVVNKVSAESAFAALFFWLSYENCSPRCHCVSPEVVNEDGGEVTLIHYPGDVT